MASYDLVKPAIFPRMQPFDKIGTATAEPVLTLFFFHRAYNTTWSTYETWITEGASDPNPPSGEPVTGLTISAFWKQVV